jgi:hypothetical protein
MQHLFGLRYKTHKMKLTILTLFMSALLITSQAQTQTGITNDKVSSHEEHPDKNNRHHHRRHDSGKRKHKSDDHKQNDRHENDREHSDGKHHK